MRKNTTLKPPAPTREPIEDPDFDSSDDEDVKQYLEQSRKTEDEDEQEFVDYENEVEDVDEEEEEEAIDPGLYAAANSASPDEGSSVFGLGLSTYAAPLHLILNLIAGQVKIVTREGTNVTLGVPYSIETTKAIKRAKSVQISLHQDLEYKESEYEIARGVLFLSLNESHETPTDALQEFLSSLKLKYTRDTKIKVLINADRAGALFIGFRAVPDKSCASINPLSIGVLEF